jgi:repressor of nif and glnA expression
VATVIVATGIVATVIVATVIVATVIVATVIVATGIVATGIVAILIQLHPMSPISLTNHVNYRYGMTQTNHTLSIMSY